jgi:methylthioribose-1-phosphate isomerase
MLPGARFYLECQDYRAVAGAIQEMRVRGAPAIGIAGAFALALAAREARERGEPVLPSLQTAHARLLATRPTAINLRWALDRLLSRATGFDSDEEIARAMLEEASAILREDLSVNMAIGQAGQALLHDGDTVLTHCNAGALATGGYGTALGVIRAAVAAGKRIAVFADETRPLLQGARLTMLELMEENIPATLICDNMAAVLMRQKKINAVITGADRIARNGDVANKIGTYGLAVQAKYHGVPFYVAAPMSTFDPNVGTGAEIPIEERAADEIRQIGGTLIAPAGAPVWNPAFDVTPAELVTAIITERGLHGLR